MATKTGTDTIIETVSLNSADSEGLAKLIAEEVCERLDTDWNFVGTAPLASHGGNLLHRVILIFQKNATESFIQTDGPGMLG